MPALWRQAPAWGLRSGRRSVPIAALLATLLSLNPAVRTCLAADPSPVSRAWPLTLTDRFLTSNFMEYRDGRFHTGLDLKTNSETGYAVLAAEDGWVVRLRASAYGYGRAVYLQGISGRFFVYAHLERFADQLRARIRHAQVQNQRYEVDLYLQADRIPVARGDVIGISGQSGAAGPHLHFEVRNSVQQPLNPLLCGFAVPDTFPPQICRIRAIPCAPESRVVGGLVARSVSAKQGLAGQLPSLTVQGPVAFTAELRDRSDIMGHRLIPQEITVRLDGTVVYRASNDSLAFVQNRQMFLEWLELPGIREKWLHRRPGNNLPGREGEPWSRSANILTPGIHRVELVISDQAGNQAQVHWQVEVRELALTTYVAAAAPEPAAVGTDQPEAPEMAADAGGRVALQWQEDPVRVTLPTSPTGDPRWLTPFLVVVRDSRTGTEVAHRADTYPGLPGDRFQVIPVEVAHEEPAARSTVLWAITDSLTRAEVMAASQDQDLEYLGAAVTVQAIDRHNWKLPVVALPVTGAILDTTLSVGVYQQGRDARWGHVETPLRVALTDSGRMWHVPVPGPGRLAVLRDGAPPDIGPAAGERLQVERRPPADLAGVTLPRCSLVAVRVHDKGSGVDPTTLRGWLDGFAVIVEPDLIRNRILLELPDDLPPGPHELTVLAEDFAGNSSVRNVTLDCQDAP